MATAEQVHPITAMWAHFDRALNSQPVPRIKSAWAVVDEAEAALRASFAEAYGADPLDEAGDWIDALDLKAKTLAEALSGHPDPCIQAMAEVFEGWVIDLTGKTCAGHALAYLAADIRWHLEQPVAAPKQEAA